jgi:hypothetical protein
VGADALDRKTIQAQEGKRLQSDQAAAEAQAGAAHFQKL